jgi:hypothetical protein
MSYQLPPYFWLVRMLEMGPVFERNFTLLEGGTVGDAMNTNVSTRVAIGA